MEGSIGQRVWNGVVTLYMIMDSGIRVQEQIPWGHNVLYWPLWGCLWLIGIIVVCYLDVCDELKRLSKRSRTRVKTRKKTDKK